MVKRNRWATAKGKVVGVRFPDAEYSVLKERANWRGMSAGEYLRWLFRITNDNEADEEGKVSVDYFKMRHWR
jgi:hypothetical protein